MSEHSWRSTLAVAGCWGAIGAVHVLELVITLVFGVVHVFLSLPVASQTMSHLRIPIPMLQATGLAYLVIAGLHAWTLVHHAVATLTTSVRAIAVRPTTVTKEHGQMQHQEKKQRPRAARSIPRLTALGRRLGCHWPVRLWRGLFGLDGAFGLHGAYFEVGFRLRELLEIMLQTYQLFRLSHSVPSSAINALGVGMLVLNTLLTPAIDMVYEQRQTQRRLMHVLLDMSLDFVCAVAIPLCVLLPYVLALDWSTGTIPNATVLNDVWQNTAIAEVRQVLVTSWLDFVSTLMPHVSFLLALSTLKQLLPRLGSSRRPGKRRISVVAPPPAHTLRLLMPSASTRVVKPTRTGRIRRAVYNFLMIAWGLGVVVAHGAAHWQKGMSVPGCRSELSPWFVRGSPCAVLQINCHQRGIHGSFEDMEAALGPIARAVLAKLIITHCPYLELPALLTEFAKLESLETFNCTLAAWPSRASLTQDVTPWLTYVYLFQTNMTEYPRGLHHHSLPRSLSNFRIHKSNLSILPEDIGAIWRGWPIYNFALEQTFVHVLPESIINMQVEYLALIGNHLLEVLPDRLLVSSNTRVLSLSGSAVRALPPIIGNPSILRRVWIERTAIDEVPEWLETWSIDANTNATIKILSAYGSPLCSRQYVDRRFCDKDFQTNESSLDIQYLVSQRDINFP